MAIVRTLGNPSLFVTFTANPDWSDITRELHPGEKPVDRPDLITIVFKLKLDALLKDIKEKAIFGVAIGTVYTVEYQKRALPHAHILVFLHPQDIPRTPQQIDELVSAQLDPRMAGLAETVKRMLVHGPCGPNHPSSPCMNHGRCTKRYPKAFCEATVAPEDSYPQYVICSTYFKTNLTVA